MAGKGGKMSEPKFTKGPWHIHPHIVNGIIQRNFIEDSEYRIICEYWLGAKNAALIAAAPEMYDLLLDIMTDYQCMPNPAVMADKIEAVLKKARGEQ
jgi:hypothetical protein